MTSEKDIWKNLYKLAKLLIYKYNFFHIEGSGSKPIFEQEVKCLPSGG